ncbi:MAG: vanadium-dependent haloperoxidase [Thermoanaerobaculia bacterium]
MSVDEKCRREEAPPGPLSRRQFLGGIGGAAAALTIGSAGAGELPKLAEDAAKVLSEAEKQSPEMARAAARREAAYQFRCQAAKAHRRKPLVLHTTNGDEDRYPNRIGNFSKGLPHNSFGEVDADAYETLLQAADTGHAEDYAAIRTSGGRRLTNPMGGLAFDLEGVDPWDLTAPPAPALASAEEAGEGVELYWMALLRDINFLDYSADHPDVAAAVADLNAASVFKGPRVNGKVTAQSLFRDPLPGALEGPYISQFLWLPTPFGAEYIDRKIQTSLPGGDHLTRYSDWLDTQNGFGSVFSRPDPVRRHIRNGRDLGEWVHVDVLFQAYFTACLILGSPTNVFDAETDGGIGAPFNPSNPYFSVRNQAGFTCWGGPHIKTLLCEVATRALKVTWHQKWQVHRRLRPEEFGGVVHHQVKSSRYPGALHRDILESKAVGRVLTKNGTGLLPIAFPEGSPTHPSYTAGHATVAGACVTILKWFYDERFVISQPVVPTPDGLALQPYQGPPLTVGGELNKLASNIATGRNIAGVHWRSDARESLRLGEEVAISILQDQRALYPEVYSGSTFTRFDGTRITV